MDTINVLLIEDDEEDYFIISDMLLDPHQLNIQYDLTWASNYHDGLELLTDEKFDIVLLDYMLGEKTGFDIIKESDTIGVSLPFVLLTDYKGRQDDLNLKSIKMGADDFLPKSQLTSALLKRSIRHAIERMKIHREVEHSEEKYRRLFELSTDPIVITDKHGTVIDANPSANQFFGRVQLESLKLRDVFNNQFDFAKITTQLQQSSSVEIEISFDNNNKETKHCRIISIQQISDKGKNVGYIHYIRDVTEQIIAEEMLQKIREQKYQNKKIEEIGKLASGVAHDFNNLLTALNGYASLINYCDDLDDIKSYADEIVKLSDRGKDLTEQILAYSRKQPRKVKIINPSTVLAELQPLIRSMVGERYEISYITSETVGNIRIDPNQLSQVILNLCINAKESMPNGGKISIKLENTMITSENTSFHDIGTGSYVHLVIEDQGSGIEDNIMNKIFEPFYTTKSSKTSTGLGLATVEGIIKQNNGAIIVQSEIDIGTQFSILFPVVDELITVERKSNRKREFDNDYSKFEILVVEDETHIRKIIKESFKLMDFNITLASNGEDALQKISQLQQLDLMITDVIMPKMNGDILICKVKEIFPEVNVIVMSGYSDKIIDIDLDSLQADEFLKKPFDFEELKSKVYSIFSS